jgi:capsular polysaccharide biosynthesis protein
MVELVIYWRIVRRRAWLILLALAVFAISYAVARPVPASGYTARMRFVVGILPEEQPTGTYTYDRYYTWLTAEYLLDDLAEVVKSQRFAADVAALSGLPVPAGAIQGATSAGKLHRVLDISLSWGDGDQIEVLANAVVATLTTQGGHYFAQLGTEHAVIAVIDPPSIAPIGPSLRQRLDLPLRLALALVIGVVLAFLADYLDPTIRHRADAATLGLPLLSEIPSPRGLWGRLSQRHRLP